MCRILRRRGSGTYAKGSRAHSSLAFDTESLYGDVNLAAKSANTEIVQSAPSGVPTSLKAAHPELEKTPSPFSARARSTVSRSSSASRYLPETTAKRYGFRRGSSQTTGLEKLAKDVRGVQQVTTAVAADAIASKQLKVAIGAPLLRVRAAYSGADGQLLAVDEMLLRPDRAHLQDTLSRAGKSRQRWQLKSA